MADWLVEFTVEDGLEDQPDLRREWHLQGKRGWFVARKGASSAFRPEFRTEAEAIDQPASLHEDTEAPKLCRLVKYRDSRSEEHTSELQSRENLVCRLL